MMKGVISLIFVFTLLISCSPRQVVRVDVFKTNDIALIVQFIKENPKSKDIAILRQRVEMLKKANQASKKVEVIQQKPKSTVELEAPEFEQLSKEINEVHAQKTVGILNQMFDKDPNNNQAIVILKNNSNCNMIMRIRGENNFYQRIPVASKTEQTFVIKRGVYQFVSSVCDANYSSEKTIASDVLISFDNPVITKL